MEKNYAKINLKSAIVCLNKIKAKLTPNEYSDMHNFLMNAMDCVDKS